MQTIVDACVGQAEKIGEREARLLAHRVQLIAELEAGKVCWTRLRSIAGLIEDAVRSERAGDKYQVLIGELHAQAVGRQVELRAAEALRSLWRLPK